MATPIRIKRSAVPGKRPQVSDLQVGELALNTYDAELVTLRDRFAATGIATGVVPLGAGATVTNVLYVTGDGDDNNTGKKLGDAKASIAGAVAISTTGDVIRVSAGTYTENNPIALPPQVSIVGDSLREVTVIPSNAGSDLFHVAPGNYITEMSFTGTMNAGKAIAAFDPNVIRYFNQSAYVRNCTNFVTNSVGLKIDGNHAVGPFKSMVTDSFTQYNQNGIGCSVSNEGYAQIVSMFTINNDVGLVCINGGQCDVTNSNSSFGNYGMISDGKGPRKYTGIVTASADADADTFALDVGITTSSISNFVYDNVSGLATVTTSGAHGFEVGMGITLSSMTLSCNYGSGTHRFVSADSNAVNVQSGAESGNQKTPNGATYVPSTGVLTLTFASDHGMSTSDTITLDNESITFTCAADDYATEHEYPRVSDPIAGVTTAITVGTTTSFTIEVGSVPLQNKVYPDGNVGYVFDVKSVPDTTSFTVNVGPSKYAHTYVSGGNTKIDVVRPFDGQVVYFDDIYEEVEKITITNGGSGYTSPPTVTIDAPGTAWGVQATAVATIVNGTVTEITLVSTGRGYTSTPSITITGAATASLTMKPILYSIKSSTPVSSGITTVTLNDNVPYAVGVGTTVPFYKQSRIIASSHSFEYIGTGVDPVQSLPQKGAVPIQDNEIDDRNGGLTIFTSTDQTGNFRIGDGVIIDQQSGTITGEFYSKSLFSQMTPFILALGGD